MKYMTPIQRVDHSIVGGIAIDRLFYHIDLVSGVVAALYTSISVAAAYMKSIEMMFIILLSQGTLETFLSMSMLYMQCLNLQNVQGLLLRP